jgi:hypothetical protein
MNVEQSSFQNTQMEAARETARETDSGIVTVPSCGLRGHIQTCGYNSLLKHCLMSFSGGGNRVNKNMDLRSPPLRWMVLEAKRYGLRLGDFQKPLLGPEDIPITPSLHGIWWLLEILPLRRLTFEDSKSTTRK